MHLIELRSKGWIDQQTDTDMNHEIMNIKVGCTEEDTETEGRKRKTDAFLA